MRGGKRENAGRKPGSHNKATDEQASAIESSGLTPLDYLVSVYRDESKSENVRIDAAKAAAPYVHARLASVELKGDPEQPIEHRVTVVDEKQVAAALAKVESEY